MASDDPHNPTVRHLSLVPDAPRPPNDTRSDYARLLARVAQGDRQAETELVLALSEPLAVVLRHRARGVESIDDLQQDALMAVLAAAREGRIVQPAALIEFALETARRLALNAARKYERQRTSIDQDTIDSSEDPQVPMLELLAEEERRHCVRSVLASLANERDRQILYSYYIEEQPSSHMQTRFALDSVQLGRVLHRARQRFLAVWRALRVEAPEG